MKEQTRIDFHGRVIIQQKKQSEKHVVLNSFLVLNL